MSFTLKPQEISSDQHLLGIPPICCVGQEALDLYTPHYHARRNILYVAENVRPPPSSLIMLHTPVCGYAAIFELSQVHPGQDVFAANIALWGKALFTLSMCTNIVVTGMIGEQAPSGAFTPSER